MIMQGIKMKVIFMSRQLGNTQYAIPTKIPPIAKAICSATEYCCLR